MLAWNGTGPMQHRVALTVSERWQASLLCIKTCHLHCDEGPILVTSRRWIPARILQDKRLKRPQLAWVTSTVAQGVVKPLIESSLKLRTGLN